MKHVALVSGPILAALLTIALSQSGASSEVIWTAAVTTLCGVWWMFEPIPIPVTSLLPLAIFPLVGVLSAEEVAQAYGDKLILLLMGGLILSSAMERSGAHRRIALTMVSLFGGTSGRRLVFGFMAASAVLSMWISNTATTLMLLPIVCAVVENVSDKRLRLALVLGVAYAASVGGTGTPIGTPPNLIFMANYTQATGIELVFTDWMRWSLPVVFVMLPLMGLWLTRRIGKHAPIEIPAVGNWRTEEVRTLLVFAVTALLWITRREPFGGWSRWANLPQANDASVAMLAVVAMFLIPNGKGEKLLNWETAVKIPWGILLLFSSGIVISKAFISSGLSSELGNSLADIGQLPTVLMIGLVCLSVTFLTELTSNTATSALLLPILAEASLAAEIEPKLIMVPAAISASYAFMLPVATGPNAIAYSSGQLTVSDMAREGVVLNLIGVLVVTAATYLMFG